MPDGSRPGAPVDAGARTPGRSEGRRSRIVILLLSLPLIAGLVSLGVWQVERRAWKLDLIERVDQRIHAPAVPAPSAVEWAGLIPSAQEYRHVRVEGTFLHERETLVQAVTELGGGYWVMTPLLSDDGVVTLVNRGFVPNNRADRATRGEGQTEGPRTVRGLLRLDEPEGRFLRSNEPANDRWFSRDVDEIASARGLENTVPYFVDADASANPGGYPIGGLTVVRFNNNHLVYALTWFGLAAMLIAAVAFTWRHGRRDSE